MTEENTRVMERKVLAAARTYFRVPLEAIFEHGQWWIIEQSGAQYAVVDAKGLGTMDGFDFEPVIASTDDYHSRLLHSQRNAKVKPVK